MKIINNNSGFTIIELLVTFMIVAILSALAMTSFAVYKEKAYNAEQKQLFYAARTSISARDDKVHLIGGSYRRIWQAYNTNNWSRLNVADTKELAPGIVNIVPDHIDLYLREYKCGTPSSEPWCQTAFVESWNCKTGNWIYHIDYNNGQDFDYEGYSAAIDAAC